uniref:Sec1 family domain-containing protein 2 n=1 Tax=Globisporangium ultimum (strain ATCC 200006 / CBS 805.95 / DAOM BR144) TaxID=431595 RepID=K3X5S3_GLOUD
MPAAVVNLAEEVLHGVLQGAEHLKGSVVTAESGAVEALRWSGALPLLLRDLSVPKLVSTESLWACRSKEQVVALLRTPQFGSRRAHGPLKADTADDSVDNEPIEHLVVIVTGFLWDYEAQVAHLLQLGAVQRLTLCSSLSERAHECYDFEQQSVVQNNRVKRGKMDFDAFATAMAVHNTCRAPTKVVAPPQKMEDSWSTSGNGRIKSMGEDEDEDEDAGDDEWGWGEEAQDADNDRDSVAPIGAADTHFGAMQEEEEGGACSVRVIQLPLNYAPLLSSKVHLHEPSVFVLCHPICATSFPLLLSHVVNTDETLVSATGAPGTPSMMYSHVKQVEPEHIPSAFRRSLKLLAYTLGEMLVNMRLDFKERIFTMGATSLKIGHTLQHIMNELHEDLSIQAIQRHQAASVLLIDRTSDLASPMSFGVSLLDRILALLPQTPVCEASKVTIAHDSDHKVRSKLHITEIFPLHGCEPSPLSASALADDEHVKSSYRTSAFLSNVKWKGGASLCHPMTPNGANAFRSLAFRPAKLALRDLDKRLQEVEHELIQQRKITKTGSTRKPGEKKPSTRGRDVVLRRICNILEAGEPTNTEHSSLIELGIIILETLERMELGQQRWDKCRERAARQIQLRKQNAGEWIIPELADTVQRHLAASGPSGTRSATGAKENWASLQELLTLLVHAFALSSGAPMEDYTLQMIRNAVSESIIETAITDPESVRSLFPDLFLEIAPYTSRQQRAPDMPSNDFGEDEDWGWSDTQSSSQSHLQTTESSSTYSDDIQRLETKAIVETYVDRLLQPLKECSQLFAKMNEDEYSSPEIETPRSLVAQLCSSIANPTRSHLPELEHIVDASEQLTRAGIDLLKSGFSRFGFGVGGGGGRGASSGNQHLAASSDIIIIFVVGGITFEEIQEVHDALGDNSKYQIILGGTTITNNEVILEQLFKSPKACNGW